MASSSDRENSPSRAATWTCDENDDDVRRMVISRGMDNQKADVHQDLHGCYYTQLPDYHGLCYVTTTSKIYNACKAAPVNRKGEKCFYGDRCFTLHKWFERLEEATGVSHGKGLYECELKNGQPVTIMVIACSDKVETLPHPPARIQAFKNFLHTKKEPIVRRFIQPKVRP